MLLPYLIFRAHMIFFNFFVYIAFVSYIILFYDCFSTYTCIEKLIISYHLHISLFKIYSHHIYLLITHIFSLQLRRRYFTTHIQIFVFLICISSPFYDYSCMCVRVTFKLYFWLISTLVLHPLYHCVVLFFHKSYKEHIYIYEDMGKQWSYTRTRIICK